MRSTLASASGVPSLDVRQDMIQKLHHLVSGSDMGSRFRECYFAKAAPADPKAIAELRSRCPWVPQGYIDFLSISDGMTFEFFVVYGTSQLWREQYPLTSYGGNDTFLCIGHDSSGDAFVVGRDGSIGFVPTDPPPERPIPLCGSFEELVDRMFCGPGYLDYFGGVDEIGESEWLEYLRKNQWV